MGMPCRSMKALEKLLLASSWAALAEGPKHGTPAAVRSSTIPGRGTVRLMEQKGNQIKPAEKER